MGFIFREKKDFLKKNIKDIFDFYDYVKFLNFLF